MGQYESIYNKYVGSKLDPPDEYGYLGGETTVNRQEYLNDIYKNWGGMDKYREAVIAKNPNLSVGDYEPMNVSRLPAQVPVSGMYSPPGTVVMRPEDKYGDVRYDNSYPRQVSIGMAASMQPTWGSQIEPSNFWTSMNNMSAAKHQYATTPGTIPITDQQSSQQFLNWLKQNPASYKQIGLRDDDIIKYSPIIVQNKGREYNYG